MWQTLLHKEILEQWRTWRLIILVAVLTISGLLSPILAFYTPTLLRSIPDMPAGLADMIPDPTVKDSFDQYVKNISQFGVLMAVILTMGVMAQEKERGTAAMLLSRPVKRSALILAKWLVGIFTLIIGLLLGGMGFMLYTAILFEMPALGSFIVLNGLILVFLSVYLTIALLASSLAKNQGMAAAGAFGGLVVLLVLSSLPRVGAYMPGQLIAWGAGLVTGLDKSAWPAVFISLGIIALALIFACLSFEREEL